MNNRVKILLTGLTSLVIAYLLVAIMGSLNKPGFKESSEIAPGNNCYTLLLNLSEEEFLKAKNEFIKDSCKTQYDIAILYNQKLYGFTFSEFKDRLRIK